MRMRRARLSDAVELARLHRATIRHVLSKDYTPDIIAVWSSRTSAKKFRASHQTHIRYVVVEKEKIIGFADIGKDGTFGAIYVHKDYIGKGVGSMLIWKIEELGKEMGVKKFEFEGSVTAKPFYQRHGYKAVRKATHLVGGKLPMSVYIMRKFL